MEHMEIEQKLKIINLHELCKENGLGISIGLGTFMSESACVCLEERGHSAGVPLKVDGDFNESVSVVWKPATENMQRASGDDEVATEYGAYGIAALLIPLLTDYKFYKRSAKGTGMDIWLIPKESLLFQNAARLEASGIRGGSESELNSRVKQKTDRLLKYANSLPYYIAVVEFGTPRSRIITNGKKAE